MLFFFLKQSFNMHEHIHSFLTHFPFICYNDTNFWPLSISHANGFITLPTSHQMLVLILKNVGVLSIESSLFHLFHYTFLQTKYQRKGY